jgi:type II secretion system protein N
MVRLLNLGPRMRKIVRIVGFALLAVVTFIFAFQLTFPFNRVKDKVIELLADKYDVTIGDVERSLIPGKMYFKAVSLRTRPTSKDEIASTLYIEQLDVGIGLFALLRGTASVKLDAKIGPGHLRGTLALSKDDTSIDLVGDDLPSDKLPMREVIGLPMSGKLRFAINLDLPNDKAKTGKVGPNWVKAEGNIELACPSGCTVGDGKSKLRPKLRIKAQQAFAEGGIDFGKVTIDTLLANVEIKNGKLSVTKFDAKSTDGEVHVDFDLALNNDLLSSAVTGCLRFRGSDALLKREAKTHAAISTTGAPVGPDNLFHIKLDGPLREMRRLALVCTAASNGNMDNPGGTPARPNLTVTPETPTPPAPSMRPPGTQLPPTPMPPTQLPPTPMPPVPSAFPPKVPQANLPNTAPPDAGVGAQHIPPSGPDGETIQVPNIPPPAAPPPIDPTNPTNPTAPP